MKDEGVKLILKGISINCNRNLRKLFLDFTSCELSFESGIYIGELFSRLPRIEDLSLVLLNYKMKGEGFK